MMMAARMPSGELTPEPSTPELGPVAGALSVVVYMIFVASSGSAESVLPSTFK